MLDVILVGPTLLAGADLKVGPCNFDLTSRADLEVAYDNSINNSAFWVCRRFSA
jgi:hypothetical protein